jgi:hypothetical protein
MAMVQKINDRKPWSTMDVFDLRNSLEQGESIEQVAAVLCRSVNEVARKAKELGLAVGER